MGGAPRAFAAGAKAISCADAVANCVRITCEGDGRSAKPGCARYEGGGGRGAMLPRPVRL